ncbi:MAG: arginine deiminase [Tissierellales bacterium]|nr:arginine deiminase [Tissierellales bacterium]
MKNPVIEVNSEIGRLRQVMLHRPGKEIENLMPEYLDRLLFDDIPYLKIAQKEHDEFAETLKSKDVEVVYLEDLVVESLLEREVLNSFIEEFLYEAGIKEDFNIISLKEYFLSLDKKEMVLKMMAGVRKSEIKNTVKVHLAEYLENDYPFLIDPMPNLYFTRDPFACIGDKVSIHKMNTHTRNRETLFAKYIFNYHPKYKKVQHLYERQEEFSIEGGDILVLSDKVLAIGVSERTNPNAIEKIALNIFKGENTFDRIIAIDIPKQRTFMHLDTVFTMVDYDKFVIHPNVEQTMKSFVLEKKDKNSVKITPQIGSLNEILETNLNIKGIKFIKCGGDSVVDAAREQWNDGSNTLCIAPGEVVVYSRNYVTNEILDREGIKLNIISSSELSRGRGGPRCMSMPFIREKI